MYNMLEYYLITTLILFNLPFWQFETELFKTELEIRHLWKYEYRAYVYVSMGRILLNQVTRSLLSQLSHQLWHQQAHYLKRVSELSTSSPHSSFTSFIPTTHLINANKLNEWQLRLVSYMD